MTSHITAPLLPQSEIETEEYLFDNLFDPIETGLQDRTRDFLQSDVRSRARRGARALSLFPAREAAERCFGERACRHRSCHGHHSRADEPIVRLILDVTGVA
jgi:hypothetical protein